MSRDWKDYLKVYQSIYLFCRRVKEEKKRDEESTMRNNLEKSLEDLEKKMKQELEDKKLEILEVKYKKKVCVI